MSRFILPAVVLLLLIVGAGIALGVVSAAGGGGSNSASTSQTSPTGEQPEQRQATPAPDGSPQAYLGVSLDDSGGTVVVARVVEDGPANKAGIQEGDMIVAADNQDVSSTDDVAAAIDEHAPGDIVTLTVRRGADERDIDVKLGERPASTPSAASGSGVAFLGVQLDDSGGTVVVAQVIAAGPADKAGIQPRDVLLAVDGEDVGSAPDVAGVIQGHAPGDTITVTLRRAGDERDFDVTLGDRPSSPGLPNLPSGPGRRIEPIPRA